MARNRAPEAVGRSRRYVSNEEYQLTEFAKVKDPDGDSIESIRIRLDGNGRGGYLYLNGRRLSTNRWYQVDASEFQFLSFRSQLRGRETVKSKLRMRGYDGKVWSSDSAAQLTTIFNSNRPRVLAQNIQRVRAEDRIEGGDLYRFFDQDLNTEKLVRFQDLSGGGGAFFYNGKRVNGQFTVRQENLELVEFIAPNKAARDKVRIRSYDGRYWSAWKNTQIITIPRPSPRSIYDISTSDPVLDEQEVMSVQSMFEVEDGSPNYELYEIYEATGGQRTGQFYGPDNQFIPLRAGTVHQFTADEVTSAYFEGGKQEQRSHDEIYGRVHNGKEWSKWSRFTANTEPRMVSSLASTSWLEFDQSRDPLVLTYSFLTQPPAYYTDGDEADANNFAPLTTPLRAAAREMLNHFEKTINVRFVERPESDLGTITFGMTDNSDDNVVAWAYFPNAPETGGRGAPGDVWYNVVDWASVFLAPNVGPGSFSYFVSMHELGHAMGLSHPFGHASSLPTATNSNQFSVMAYAPHGSFVNTGLNGDSLQLYDVAALQSLYGANTRNAAGNTVYRFGTDEPVLRTIWDTSGQDTIDVSNQVVGQTVDLRQGRFSSVSRHVNPILGTVASVENLSIAYGADIEHAIGSGFDDELIGNHLSNNLTGHDGDDVLQGNQGNDLMSGGLGHDTYIYTLGDGFDRISERGGGIDVIQIKHIERFSLSDLTFSRKGTNLKIDLTIGDGGASEGSILVRANTGGSRVERLELYQRDNKLEVTYDLRSIYLNSRGDGQSFESSGVLGTFGMLANPV